MSSNVIATPPLNWENIDYMPTPAGMPVVLVPWASGASRQFTPEMANDYRSTEGWTLVYNTFNTTITYDNWYFILYNKYIGLIRMYYYVPANANYVISNNITHTLAVEGSYATSSPMMNFADKEIVDVGALQNTAFCSRLEQWQIARGTWYILQHELANDRNMSNQNYGTFNFHWPLKSTALSNIMMQGTSSGTLTGSISVPGTNFTLSPSFALNGSKKSTVTLNGKSDADKLTPTFGASIVSSIKSGITSGIQDIVKNVLTGVF